MNSDNLKDHKQIGQQQELFFTNDIAPGAPFWLPNGMIIFKELEKYIRELTEKNGYQETSTPIMVKSELFKQSGHWEKFGEHNMYNLPIYEDEEIAEGKVPMVEIDVKGKKQKVPQVNYTLKPMNCPESTVIYRFRPRSYRELPLRLSELGRLHRREKSGEVNGLLRVRQITMDDAHLYVTEDQIMDEISSILRMMIEFYDKFGFEYEFRLATRPEIFAGSKKNWDKAEKDLEEALKRNNLKYSIKEQDGAFYGPKIDVHIKDSLGREWQLATVQLDFHQPEAFDLKYIDNDGSEKRPVMIHRAIFGSFERFIGILTEHYQGVFPIFLSPVQVVIIPISNKQNSYAEKVLSAFEKEGIRVKLDARNETMQGKIRDAALQKAPLICIIGGQEEDKGREKNELIVTARHRDGRQEKGINLSSLIKKLKEDIEKKN